METDLLLKEVKSRGFDSLEDFVRANLHYVSKEKQELFTSLFGGVYDSEYAGGDGYAKS